MQTIRGLITMKRETWTNIFCILLKIIREVYYAWIFVPSRFNFLYSFFEKNKITMQVIFVFAKLKYKFYKKNIPFHLLPSFFIIFSPKPLHSSTYNFRKVKTLFEKCYLETNTPDYSHFPFISKYRI